MEVGGVELGDGGDTGQVVLVHSWSILPDKKPWTYRTTMPMERNGDSWRGEWSAGVVVADLGDGERLRAVRLGAERADILGVSGAPLVEMRDVVRLGIDRSAVPDGAAASRSAARLATLVDVDPAPYVARVAGSGPRAFVEAITYRADAAGPRGCGCGAR